MLSWIYLKTFRAADYRLFSVDQRTQPSRSTRSRSAESNHLRDRRRAHVQRIAELATIPSTLLEGPPVVASSRQDYATHSVVHIGFSGF